MKNMIIVCVKSKKFYDMIFRDCDSSRKREINKKKREGAAENRIFSSVFFAHEIVCVCDI